MNATLSIQFNIDTLNQILEFTNHYDAISWKIEDDFLVASSYGLVIIKTNLALFDDFSPEFFMYLTENAQYSGDVYNILLSYFVS